MCKQVSLSLRTSDLLETLISLDVYFALANSLAATGEVWGDILVPIVPFEECLEDALKKQSERAAAASNQAVPISPCILLFQLGLAGSGVSVKR